MFTKSQLTLLIDAQKGKDWSPNQFLNRLPQSREERDCSGAEFDELMAILERFNFEEIADLQVALTILDNLRK